MFSVRNRMVLVCLIAIATASTSSFAQGGPGAGQGGRKPTGDQITSIDERTSGMKKIDGFFPLYWDEAAGRLWLEIPRLNTEVLYSTGTRHGARIERHRARPRHPDRLAHRQVRTRRAEGADGATELSVPRADDQRGGSAHRA